MCVCVCSAQPGLWQRDKTHDTYREQMRDTVRAMQPGHYGLHGNILNAAKYEKNTSRVQIEINTPHPLLMV